MSYHVLVREDFVSPFNDRVYDLREDQEHNEARSMRCRSFGDCDRLN